MPTLTSEIRYSQTRTLPELTASREDLQEALDGLQWQYDKRHAELEELRGRVAELNSIRETFGEYHHEVDFQSRINRHLLLTDMSLLRGEIKAAQQQVEYLACRIRNTRTKIEAVSRDIVLKGRMHGKPMQRRAQDATSIPPHEGSIALQEESHEDPGIQHQGS